MKITSEIKPFLLCSPFFVCFRSETPVTTATTTPTTTTTVSTASETFAKETFEEVTESTNIDSNNNQIIGTSTNSYIDIKIPMNGSSTKGMGRQLQKELKTLITKFVTEMDETTPEVCKLG